MKNRVSLQLALFVFVLCQLSFIDLKPTYAQEASSDTSLSDVKGKSEYTATYIVALPTAGTHDFISRASFLGFGFDYGHYINDRMSLGIEFRWNRLFQEDDRATYQTDEAAITGKQYKAINIFPILPRFKFDLITDPANKWVPYLELGLGPVYGQKYRTVGNFNFNNYGWQFAFAPEVGVYVRSLYGSTGALLSIRYDVGLGTDAFPAYSAFNFSIGIRQVL
jgi:outer membrane protein